MNKSEYIEKYGYISNTDFKSAFNIARDYGIHIKDWKLPFWKRLNSDHIKLMIELRLHIKYSCLKDFKNNFYLMSVLPENKGVEAINYTGHTLCYNGNIFFGNYKFCIYKNKKIISIENEYLFYIDGLYPIISCSSCLEEDLQRVNDSNPIWWKQEVIPVKIIPYFYSN